MEPLERASLHEPDGDPRVDAAAGARRRFSIARLPRWWYVACRSSELRNRPLARTILDRPLVLFRDGDGRAAALADRCAHRNVPLSLGRCVAGRVECAYHGWQYDGGGVCRTVPALRGEPEGKARNVAAHAVVERQGYVWVCPEPGHEPAAPPYAFRHLDDPAYTSIHVSYDVEATLHAALENVLDVPHTAFLHRGLFRGGERRAVTATVRRWADRTEAAYAGEPLPTGVAARLLAPRGGVVEHVDRFVLPSVGEVEYRLGADSHLLVTNVLTPIADFATRFFAVVTFRLPMPAGLVRAVLSPIARHIFRQDARILKVQTDAVRRFGREEYASTAVDLLGPQVWRLLEDAERGIVAAPADAPAFERTVELLA
jgi:phenylpropionate dioxygenase-like ring-hydroxylating dioxygenase large terminal subunit